MPIDRYGKNLTPLQRLADQRYEQIVILKCEMARLRERVAELETLLLVHPQSSKDHTGPKTH